MFLTLIVLLSLFWGAGSFYIISLDWESIHNVTWFDVINWFLIIIFLPCIAIFFVIDMVVAPLQYVDRFSDPIFPKKKKEQTNG